MKKFTFLFVFAIAANLFLASTAFGQILQRGTATTANGTTSLVITKPTGVVSGDVMIVNISQAGNTSGNINSNPTSLGWTLIAGADLLGNTERWGAVLYKVAGGSEPANYTFTLHPDADGSVGSIVAFFGVDVLGGVNELGAAGGPFDVDPGSINVTDASTATATAITTVTANAAVIMFAQVAGNASAYSSWAIGGSISPFNELYDNTTTTGEDASVGAAWGIKVAAGSTGNGTVTLSPAERSGGILVALKPVTGPPPAATVTINPPALSISTILVGGNLNLTATRNSNASWTGGNGNFQYTWSATGPAVLSFTSNPNTITGTSSATNATGFSVAGEYTIICTVQEQGGGLTKVSLSKTVNVLAVAPTAANLWATSTDGTRISHFVVSSGTYFSGPTNDFTPTFSGTAGATSTAALGKGVVPNAAQGHFYYLPNGTTNTGNINIYGATFNGGTINVVGSVDADGGTATNSLGFVRLAMGPDGKGWILAGDGTTVYLAKFVPGANPTAGSATTSTEDANGVTLVGGLASTFQNGDICLDGNGTIYALANNGSGVTQIFRGNPNGNSTTLTKVFDLVDNLGAPFTGTVNGVAFDLLGSLYISTSTGLFFIDAGTVNGPAGTVGCFLVQTQDGLQDLASNVFPVKTTLPATLLSFAGNYRNQNTTLSWDVTNLQNFSHFEIERSTDGTNFASIVSKQPTGNAADRVTYQHIDNLAAVSGTAFYYRLKMIDNDGKFKYSNVILVRKEGKTITGINISPNPVISRDMVTVRFESAAKATIDFKVIDMAGRVVAMQQNKVAEGTNSVTINNLERLQPGIYIVQMNDGTAVQTAKLIIAK